MINCLSLLGASRSGKTALVSLLAALEKVDMPFNTPDLDWYVDAYKDNRCSIDLTTNLCVQYMLCYSWYSYLGRHVNNREIDYYSLSKLKPHLENFDYTKRNDDDETFINYLRLHEQKKVMSFFMWDIPAAVFEELQNYPVNLNIIYCQRNPFDLVNQWIATCRVQRSKYFSRMFKFDSIKNLQKKPLSSQFMKISRIQNAEGVSKNKFYYSELDLSKYRISKAEIRELTKLVKAVRHEAKFWEDKGILVNYENVVSNPEKITDFIAEKLETSYAKENLAYAIKFLSKRPLSSVLETNLEIIRRKLNDITDDEEFIEFIVNEQKQYIDSFSVQN